MTRKTARKILCVAIVLVLALGTYVNLSAEPAKTEDERTQWSLTWLKNALEGNADESVLTEAMSQALAAQGGLTAVLDGLKASVGPVQSYGEPISGEQQGMYIVVVPITFEKMPLQAIVTTDESGKVAGLLFQPVIEAAEVPLPEGATAEDVTVDAGTGYPLGGTLTVPASVEGEKLPAALLVWGSGANGRDETLGANRVFGQLASGLAERGIITLRFDKRVYTYPDAASAPLFSVQEEYVEDVTAALELLKTDPRVDADKVYLIGHSQGGMLAPRLASQTDGLAGIVLMAGSPRDLSDILYDQEMDTIKGLEAPEQKAQYDAWREEAEALYALDEAAAKAHDPLYSGAFHAYYLWEMHQYDAIELMKQLRMPSLIVQGGNDWQVYADVDYKAFQDALKDEDFVQFKLYDGLNHAFMPSVATNLSDAMLEYNQAAEIPAVVLDDLAGFVKGK